MSLVDLIYSTDTVLPQDLKPTNYYSATGSSESGNHHLSTVNIGLIVGGCVVLLLVLSSLIVFGILCGYHKWKMRGITRITEVELPDAAVANISGQDKRHSSMLYNEIYDNKEPRASSLVIINGQKRKLTIQPNIAYEKLSNNTISFDHTYESIP